MEYYEVAGGKRYIPDPAYARKPVEKEWFKKDVTFQLMDINQFRSPPVPGMPGPQNVKEITGIRIFGVTSEGQSVLAVVHGFQPYIWIQAPPGWRPSHAELFRRMLNTRLEGPPPVGTGTPDVVQAISVENKMSLLGYQNEQYQPFLRITALMPGYVTRIRDLLQGKAGGGVEFPPLWSGQFQFITYESNVLFPLRFMVDNHIGGSNWITCPAGSFTPHLGEKESRSQIELTIAFDKLVPHECTGDFMKIAPVRIMSFDIECEGRPGKFPEAEHDPVIQIAASVRMLQERESFVNVVFCLKETAPIPGVQLYCFEDEKDLLMAFADFYRAVNTDVVTGYNIVNFDVPYLLNRASTLNLVKFPFLSRMVTLATTMKTRVFQSKAHGRREFQEFDLPGNVIVDLLVVIQKEHKLRSYTLNNVSHNFLGEQKEDVHHSIIATLQNGNPETRNRLARYCFKDAVLPLRLMEKLMTVVNLIEMARVSGVPLSWLIDKGQQIKVYSQILRKTLHENLLFPTHDIGDSQEAGFQGATVIEPHRGFYDHPIATLDFASLYPSIMMAHNLCYSTLLNPGQADKFGLGKTEYECSPAADGCAFAVKSKKHGLLPRILQDLLAERKKAKRAMAEATDPMEQAVYNGRQLALKISANSVYGFTGATVGKLPCLAISRAVTAYGRQMIDVTKNAVEKTYTKENGYEADATVVYGDTDSVMVSFGSKTSLERSMELGKEAADEVTKLFPNPVKLEFEKCYFPYLLMNKKRYAGLLWTNADKHDKLDAKGIESVRRDNCPLVANLVQKVLKTILLDRSVDKAVDYVKQVISDLLMNRLDVSHLVISKTLTMDREDYAGRQAHAELAERMRQRDPGSAPSVGDRVPYVFVRGLKDAKAYEKSEDPLYVLEKNLPIDAQYYLQHQLKLPLLRLFEGVIPHPEATLLQGAHTRKMANPTPTNSMLMKFAKVVLSCVGCKAKLSSDAVGPLCDCCKPNEASIYARELSKRKYYGSLFSRVWTQCQRCQGSLHETVLCTNRDCSVFYMRKKVQKDLKQSQDTVDRFGHLDW
eukprot:TRINITY_DN24368_c0_g1_i1.p1 TRINITY_DN24368_c0_g1~~TRINITY_DN24368_c0_g1_i1.p1  ORF type:complete len:1051 (+),score=234.92 TRINITY_DN24368_c0_g1_i1:38-3190(+)